MKRFFTFLAILAIPIIVILAVNDAICLWLVRNSPGNSATKIERFYNGCVDDEVIILGSSLARRGLIPTEIADKCFNYAEDGVFFFEMSKLFADAVLMDGPNTIIYVFDPWGFTENSIARLVADYSLAPCSGNLKWYQYLPGVRFFCDFRGKYTSYKQSQSDKTLKFIKGSVVRNCFRDEQEWMVIQSKIKEKKLNFKYAPEGDAILRNILSSNKNKNIVFVLPPSTPVWREMYEDHDKVVAYLKGLVTFPRVRIVDFFVDETFSYEDFFDAVHLNSEGATKFSSKLAYVLNIVNHE